jgi:hypothetical protein
MYGWENNLFHLFCLRGSSLPSLYPLPPISLDATSIHMNHFPCFHLFPLLIIGIDYSQWCACIPDPDALSIHFNLTLISLHLTMQWLNKRLRSSAMEKGDCAERNTPRQVQRHYHHSPRETFASKEPLQTCRSIELGLEHFWLNARLDGKGPEWGRDGGQQRRHSSTTASTSTGTKLGQ